MSDEIEITETEDPITFRQRLQEHLQGLEAFMQTRAYVFYKEAREAEIKNLKEMIIVAEPIDRKTEIESYKMRGDLRTTEEFLTVFEDARVTLKQRIEVMLEREQQNTKSKEQ